MFGFELDGLEFDSPSSPLFDVFVRQSKLVDPRSWTSKFKFLDPELRFEISGLVLAEVFDPVDPGGTRTRDRRTSCPMS